MSRESKAAFVKELISFGLVGGVGLVVDIVVFNALRTTILSPSVHGWLFYLPSLGKTGSRSLNFRGNKTLPRSSLRSWQDAPDNKGRPRGAALCRHQAD